ncbi:1-deoxy-D-xylulose-5-phosphate reductoisomerase [Acinetobacter sp. ESL0695]|uniref:1-deoxy-D-xylulose-5-phosphate reductoisomerase n=1 Tax=Acinetobacter sp. ESL0695 TaxID=2983215 RepID=UPI0023F4A336|nr:1-deoxy-D-xylulose-5-phosphate reductoisomerase [Acinetobacter sp. ESL0695]WEV47955.1 1-deoxy-D-xylulose-5-phosphate reductoisomerase [Acinetobacter sp. ESL0695]
MKQSVCILGATGSIGQSTLKVLEKHPKKYNVFAVTAHSRLNALVEICIKFKPQVVVVPECKKDEADQLFKLYNIDKIEILTGDQGLITVASHKDVDIVMAAIVGAAGLLPTLAAVKTGKRVLLANKESLVMSGDLMMQEAKRNNALLLPVDSEHNAIFQCLPEQYMQVQRSGVPELGVSRVLLTASGGPFLNMPIDRLEHVTPSQACKHPNWSMGQKISVDSATLMNKGLELIEACHLFAISERFVTVVVHPQSIIHSMVQYIDGSTIAQMGNPDMCTPIAHALAWPERINAGVAPLDLFVNHHLDFQEPDLEKFPALNLCREAMKAGGTAPAILNAANEIAVESFLKEKISFTHIPYIVEATLNCIENTKAEALDVILEADQAARKMATSYVIKMGK